MTETVSCFNIKTDNWHENMIENYKRKIDNMPESPHVSYWNWQIEKHQKALKEE